MLVVGKVPEHGARMSGKCRDGVVMGIAVQANTTIIVQNYKQGNLLNDALDYSGDIHLIDVGILQTIFPETQILLQLNYMKNKLSNRRKNTHKYHYGNILTIGGSKGMMGAPILSGLAALKTGSGLSHILYHNKYLHHIHNVLPDLMVNTYTGIEELPSISRKKSTVIFGPGLGKQDPINTEIIQHLLSTDIPLLVDADGLYYLKQVIKEYNQRENIVITPHYQEMADFLGIDIEEVKREPILYAKNIAHTYNVTVVLKGVCTMITNDHETYFSIYGNPGMATAGTGDVLSGIIGSLLGRGFSPMEASKIGVLIHSESGRLAENHYGQESLIASNLIEYIHEVLKHA